MDIKRARLVRGPALTVAVIILAALAAWLVKHIYQIASPGEVSGADLAVVWLLTFVSIVWTQALALLERPRRGNPRRTDRLKVAVLVPAYNEDEPLLRACIESLLGQSRRPQYIEVVDDGSADDYPAVRAWLAGLRGQYPDIRLQWTRTKNGGKRHAQAVGMRNTPDADIYLTVDSDTILDPEAIAQGLLPFTDPAVQSVAGVCLPLNVNENLLTRFTGLHETVWQLTERSALSTMGCVTVNSGVLAFYRAATIRRYVRPYLTETFFKRPVKFSDDSMLTLYSLLDGRTVQQTTSLAFSAVPNRYNHHIRRYTRWMRGSFIRSFWRFKYLPLTSYVYWLHLFRWTQFALSLAVTVYLAWSGLLTDPGVWPYLIAVPVVISYMQSLRYFIIRRSDETRRQQILTYLTAPIAILWLVTVLRIVKYYAYMTVLQNKWGTRQNGVVEVRMAEGATA